MVSLKLFIDKKNNRVLFAEAGKEFIDFLFNIVVLPVGTFIPLLNQEMFGSMGKIYDSIQNLSYTYLQQNASTLLMPKVYISRGTGVPLQLSNIVSSKKRKLHRCDNGHGFISENRDEFPRYGYFDKRCPSCGLQLSSDIKFLDVTSNDGVKEALYIVMNDLEVKPLSTISIISLLNQFRVNEDGALEEKVVELGNDVVCQSFFAFCACMTSIYFLLLFVLSFS
jgi:hypothetical protein